MQRTALKLVCQATNRAARSASQMRDISSARKSQQQQQPPPASLSLTHLSTSEGASWITTLPKRAAHSPRARARKLRLAGDIRAAHRVLRNAGVDYIRDEQDLYELLTVILQTDEFSEPGDRIRAMFDAVAAVDLHPKRAYQIMLVACARDAAFISDNSPEKRNFVMRSAVRIWHELLAFGGKPNSRSIALMYQICGDCKDIDRARKLRAFSNDPKLCDVPSDSSTEEATAAFILCLGRCGLPHEAEHLYFSELNRNHRTSDVVLGALFLAYLAANRVSKAEALISMYGSSFLNAHCCNAFVKTCSGLRMYNTALDFLDRMARAGETGFPQPTARTYNLLLLGLSTPPSGPDDRDVAVDKALIVISKMKSQGIQPNTVTYNTLVRSVIARGQLTEGLAICTEMKGPDHITFSHLMQGAANNCDIDAAEHVLKLLRQSEERPNYVFYKSYLEVTARVKGPAHAFVEAKNLMDEFGESLVFGNVGSEEAMRMALIHACGKAHDLRAAFNALGDRLTEKAIKKGDLAPLYVATVLMQACLDCGAIGQAVEVYHSLKTAGLRPNFEVYESLINGLALHVRECVSNSHGKSEGISKPTAFSAVLSTKDTNKACQEFSEGKIQNRQKGETAHEAFTFAINLLREMHKHGEGRSSGKASYVYNSLLGAASAIGQWGISMEIFQRMTKHSDVLGLAAQTKSGSQEREQSVLEADIRENLSLLRECGDLPPASVNTYNAMMISAFKAERPKDAMMVFEQMQGDREMEPNASTLNILADVALQSALSVNSLRDVLHLLDRAVLSERLAKKRVELRKKLLRLRWIA